MPKYQNPAILAVVGPKGGVGKTTLAAHMAAYLGSQNSPAVLADLDAQAAATSWLLPDPPPFNLAADLEAGRPMRTIPAPNVPGLLVAPGDLELAGWDLSFDRTRQRLPGTLKPPGAASLVVCDLAPSWGALLSAALLCASRVLVVAEARELGLAGLERMLDLVEGARKQNRRLRLVGIVCNRVTRTRLGRDVEERIRGRYRAVLPSVRESVRLAETAQDRRTLWQTNLDHPVRDDLQALARAVKRALK